jgi:hypothetical protein
LFKEEINMASTPDLALLALRVYATPGAIAPLGDKEFNRPAVPAGWTELEWHADDGWGYSYGVYKNGSEIVISYAGTNEGIDWLANATNGLGVSSSQVTSAATAYLQAKQQYGGDITLTGHSLGGGLASIMAVWFDRPAVVFDEAPFELTGRNVPIVQYTKAVLALAGYSDPAFTSYVGLLDFYAREAQVQNHYVGEEALQIARMLAPTIMGTDNRMEFGVTNMLSLGGRVDLHSQALLAAGSLSTAFPEGTISVQQALPLLMDKNFYALSTAGPDENVLINFIRSEQGLRDIEFTTSGWRRRAAPSRSTRCWRNRRSLRQAAGADAGRRAPAAGDGAAVWGGEGRRRARRHPHHVPAQPAGRADAHHRAGAKEPPHQARRQREAAHRARADRARRAALARPAAYRSGRGRLKCWSRN